MAFSASVSIVVGRNSVNKVRFAWVALDVVNFNSRPRYESGALKNGVKAEMLHIDKHGDCVLIEIQFSNWPS